ncbi:MAG TPA: hypothetical protein VN455_05165 [Methanotrichaceae archaeon]|nr:hypothetical protein [Methanotrichaceae archaeon]
MRLIILSLLLLALMPLGTASTTTFDLGNYTVGMDYMPSDTKYLQVGGPNIDIQGVRLTWGDFDPGVWTEIMMGESQETIFNLSDLNGSTDSMLHFMRFAVLSATGGQLTNDTGVAVVWKPYFGLVASGTLEASRVPMNVYSAIIDNCTILSVTSNGRDNTFGNIISNLVITRRGDVPMMRANSIAEKLNRRLSP